MWFLVVFIINDRLCECYTIVSIIITILCIHIIKCPVDNCLPSQLLDVAALLPILEACQPTRGC